mmetsp:Transcript_18922/g.23293  ORF Transcript_18922/g.23293 Transcript_18922/m.23293 type:complete len:121 (-) Transcript_18922:1571-1933(-)
MSLDGYIMLLLMFKKRARYLLCNRPYNAAYLIIQFKYLSIIHHNIFDPTKAIAFRLTLFLISNIYSGKSESEPINNDKLFICSSNLAQCALSVINIRVSSYRRRKILIGSSRISQALDSS